MKREKIDNHSYKMKKEVFMDFAFHSHNTMARTGSMMALSRLISPLNAPPVFLCIGSDLSIGDSLGPIAGTLIKQRTLGSGCYVYGTLKTPLTAKEIKYTKSFLKKAHPNATVIAIDAALGDEGEIGLIKITDSPLRPGSGANKKLGKIGDISILGIVAPRTNFTYNVLNLTRLNLVYTMANVISGAICDFLLKERSEHIPHIAVSE